VLFSINSFSQKNIYNENKAKIEEWKNDRFGMFIHWGPVTLTGEEISWSRGKKVSVEEYDKLYEKFNPVNFNAEEWVKIAKDAGMRYIILTTKHHDGFCLWNTQQTDYNIMNSPFKRDVVKELAEACKKNGIKFGAYYSTCDWYNPDFPVTSPAGKKKRENSNLDRYTNYLKRQIGELLLNYGPLYALWFDVPQLFDSIRGQGVIDFAREIQPDILINNRTGAKGDFDTPEQRIGGFNNERPWETCMTIAKQWTWKPNDKVKSFEQCIQTLIRTAGGDGNLLFNIGPKPDGSVEPEQISRLKEMGEWMKKYGESIYGTRGGPFKPTDWGVSTRKGNHIYLHILAWNGNKPILILPDLGIPIKKCSLMNGGKIKLFKKENSYVIEFSSKYLNSTNTIIDLEMERDIMDLPVFDTVSQSLIYNKKATASSEPDVEWHGVKYVCNGDWTGLGWYPDKNDNKPWIEFDLEQKKKVSKMIIYEATENAVKQFEVQCFVDSRWKTIYKGEGIGEKMEIKLPPTMTSKIKIVFSKISSRPEIAEIIVL
jgi:alpha-L-fucosidase